MLARIPTHIVREHRHCDGTKPGGYDLDPFEYAWRTRVLDEALAGAADRKARDFAVFYFDTPRHERNMSHAAMCYGIERETAAAYLMRMDKRKYLKAMGSPIQARDKTLRRVYLRRVFWTDDPWTAY